MQQLLDLETQGWQALSTSGSAAVSFYESVLHEQAVMLFPGDLVIEGKEKILQSFGQQPWKSFLIETHRTVALGDAAAVLIYRITAQREGDDIYAALISSTYVHDADGWKLMVHQQTPV